MALGVDFVVRPISVLDSVNNFKTGHKAFLPLKTFLKKQAKGFQRSMLAQTYVCVEIDSQGEEHNKIIAYISLTCSEIDLRNSYEFEDCTYANQYDSLPAIKIARLAVDNRYHGQGVGSILVNITTAIALDEIAPVAGCRFVMTDAKQGAVDFYKKQDFTLLGTSENLEVAEPVMFMDLLRNKPPYNSNSRLRQH